MKKIAITGPESTGKSRLAAALAAHFGGNWVREYARKYLAALNRPYQREDILQIAKGQLLSEAKIAAQTSGSYLFCDTEMLVCKIWQEFKYGERCDEWIESAFCEHHYDLFLLCDIDLMWEEDPMREHPTQRKVLFDRYFKALSDYHKPFVVVSGQGGARLANACVFVEGIGAP